MPVCIWRGEWYIYHHSKREFVERVTRYGSKRSESPDDVYVVWTPSLKRARAYKNPSAAAKAAGRINAQTAVGPILPVSVVTGEAARCLDLINRRPREALI